MELRGAESSKFHEKMKFFDWKIKVLENEKAEIEKDKKMDLKQQRKELSDRSDAIKTLLEQRKAWKENHQTKKKQKMFNVFRSFEILFDFSASLVPFLLF